MIVPPDYIAEEKRARLANAEELRERINEPDTQRKIANWAERFSLEPEFVRYKVLTDDTFALQFIKDPGRQSLHQRVAAAHLNSKVPLVQDFQALSSGGPNAEYVVNGLVVSHQQFQSVQTPGKSIDFKWRFARSGRVLRVYATHKHTKEEGGSQDNQFADVKAFFAQAAPCRDPNTLFLAIVDGEYYQRPARTPRIRELQQGHAGPRSAVCTIASLPRVYGAALYGWFGHHGLVASQEEQQSLDVLFA